MGQLTPVQRTRREQVEGVIRLMAPALNVVLALGERISRIAESEDTEYYPPRVSGEEPTKPGSGSART